MFVEPELSEGLDEFHVDPEGNEPADDGDELPEDPMPGPCGQLQHDPGIIKGNKRFPAGGAGFFEHFGQADGGQQEDEQLDDDQDQYLMRGHIRVLMDLANGFLADTDQGRRLLGDPLLYMSLRGAFCNSVR